MYVLYILISEESLVVVGLGQAQTDEAFNTCLALNFFSLTFCMVYSGFIYHPLYQPGISLPITIDPAQYPLDFGANPPPAEIPAMFPELSIPPIA